MVGLPDDPIWRLLGPVFQQGVVDQLERTEAAISGALPKLKELSEQSKELSGFLLGVATKDVAYTVMKGRMKDGRQRQDALNKRSPREK